MLGTLQKTAIATLCFLLFGASQAGARDTVTNMSIAEALAAPDAVAKLDGTVKFYFGETAHPAITKSFGKLVAHQKTNAFNKSAKRACEWAFLSALLKFQKRAGSLGANAVVGINSYYDKKEVSSTSTIECHDGFLMTGVALRGEFVTVADH